MADLDDALVSYLSDKYNGDEKGDNEAIMNEIDDLPDSASMAGSDKSSGSSDSDSGSSSDADTVVDNRKATDEKDRLRRRKSAKKNVNENALRKRRSARKRRKKTLSESVEKNLASQRRKSGAESTLAIAQSPAAATHAAQVAEEMIDRAVDRDDRRRPTRFVPSALCTLTSVMETRSDLVRILEHARALHHLDLLVPSALIDATLTVSVDDRALDLLKRRVVEASKNTEPLE